MTKKNKKKNKGGRPSGYGPEVIEKVKQYLDDFFNEELEEVVPSIEGFSAYSGIARRTIYDWKGQHKEFSHILEDILALQASLALNKGLKGEWNSNIVKLLLGKHGYKAKSDVTSGGKSIGAILDDLEDE